MAKKPPHFIYVKRNHLYAKLQLLLIGIQTNKSLGACGFFPFFNGNLDSLFSVELRVLHSVASQSLDWTDGKKCNSREGVRILTVFH